MRSRYSSKIHCRTENEYVETSERAAGALLLLSIENVAAVVAVIAIVFLAVAWSKAHRKSEGREESGLRAGPEMYGQGE